MGAGSLWVLIGREGGGGASRQGQMRIGLASGPAAGLQGKPFLCMSVLRKVRDSGARRGRLDGGHFKMTTRY